MSKVVKKYNENVLNLKIDTNNYAIHRRNIAGIAYVQTLSKSKIYSLVFHLIKPLQFDKDGDSRHNYTYWALSLNNATYKDYLGLLHWFDNPSDLLEEVTL